MGDLVKLSGNLPSLTLDDDMRKALADSTSDDSAGGSGVEYVYFSGKSGELTFGQDREDLDQTEEFILLTPTIFKGWMCWKNSEVVGRHKWSAFKPQNAVAEEDLEDHKVTRAQDGWKQTIGFEFIGADGTQYSFETSTKSGRGAVKKLIDRVIGRDADEPQVALFTFGVEKFLAQGEWNWKPKFDVVEWMTVEEAEAYVAGEAEPEPEPEPKPVAGKRKRRA